METLHEELEEDLEQLLNIIDTLKVHKALQVGPPECMPSLVPLPARGAFRITAMS